MLSIAFVFKILTLKINTVFFNQTFCNRIKLSLYCGFQSPFQRRYFTLTYIFDMAYLLPAKKISQMCL